MSESTAQQQSDETQGQAIIASSVEGVTQANDRLALDEQIRIRAYEIYRQRAGGIGDDINDWLQAESECRGQLDRAAGNSVHEQRLSAAAQPENPA